VLINASPAWWRLIPLKASSFLSSRPGYALAPRAPDKLPVPTKASLPNLRCVLEITKTKPASSRTTEVKFFAVAEEIQRLNSFEISWTSFTLRLNDSLFQSIEAFVFGDNSSAKRTASILKSVSERNTLMLEVSGFNLRLNTNGWHNSVSAIAQKSRLRRPSRTQRLKNKFWDVSYWFLVSASFIV